MNMASRETCLVGEYLNMWDSRDVKSGVRMATVENCLEEGRGEAESSQQHRAG